MTTKRALNMELVKAMRAEGHSWQEIAKAVNWSLPWLMRRARDEGLVEAAQPLAIGAGERLSSPAAEQPKRPTLKEQVAELAKLGASLEQVAIITGKPEAAILQAIKSSWPEYAQKAHLEAKLELARATWARALSGDKSAIIHFNRGLFDY